MASESQIDANCRNSQKSTGPRTEQGKAASRFNALKSGIHAKSQIIPGENADDLEELTTEYQDQFRPATAPERFLVDTLIASEWQLRRLRKAEAQLWQHEINDAADTFRGLQEDCPLGHVFDRGRDGFSRMQRCIQSAERSYLRALKELNRLQSGAHPAPDEEPLPEPAPDPRPPAPDHDPELASFRPGLDPPASYNSPDEPPGRTAPPA